MSLFEGQLYDYGCPFCLHICPKNKKIFYFLFLEKKLLPFNRLYVIVLLERYIFTSYKEDFL